MGAEQIKGVIILLMVILAPDIVTAAAVTSGQSGPWSSPTTWVGGVVPGDGDEVLIADGHAVEIDRDIGSEGLGLKMLRVGTHNGSAARLFFDGRSRSQAVTLRFASRGKDRGVDAFGIHFWGSIQLEGTLEHPLVIEPVVQDGSAVTFIQKDPNSSRVDLILRDVILRRAGDEQNAGIDVWGASRSGERVIIEGNRFEESGSIQLAGADGGGATISLSRNEAVDHRGSFVQFRAARNLLIDRNRITLVAFPVGAPGQAVIDGIQGDGVGGGIRIEGNTILSTIDAESATHPRRYAIWLNGFPDSVVAGNRVAAQGVSYGFEEGVTILGGAGRGANIRIDRNNITGTIHGVGIHTVRTDNSGIEVTRNRIFDNRNEHIFISEGHQIRIVNNLLYGTLHSGQAGILLYNTDQVEIVHNTLDGIPSVSTAGIAIGNQGIGVSQGVVVKNNILTRWNKAIQNRPAGNTFREVAHNLFFENVKNYDLEPIDEAGAGDVLGDPKYVDLSSSDYHLQTGSAAIDRADPAGAPAEDINGQARPAGAGFDIGADEYREPASADLAAAVGASPDRVIVGGRLTYVVTVTNHGPAMANEVAATVTLPSEIALLSIQTDRGSCDPGGICSLGELESAEQAVITVETTAVAAGLLNATARVAGREADPDAGNNTASAEASAVPADDGGGGPPIPSPSPPSPPPSDSIDSSRYGFGCGAVQPASGDRGFRRSDLSDLLLLAWPLFFLLFRRSKRLFSLLPRNAVWVGGLLLMLLPLEAGGATITSTRSGPWSSASTWAGGRVPGDGDEVIIADGHTVQIDRNVGTSAQGLRMLRVGTRNGSTAVLKYDGAAAARGYTIVFGSTGKTEGQDAFGIRFFGTVDLQGSAAKALVLEPRFKDGRAITFIRKEGASTEVDLTLRGLTFRFLGDGERAGIDASNGSQIAISDNTFEQSGFIQLAGANGTAGAVLVSGNTAAEQKGSFVQFRAARGIDILQNQVTIASFPAGAPGQAMIDSIEGDEIGTDILIEGNTLISTIDAENPTRRLFGIWLSGVTESVIRGNRISAQGVAYGYEEGISILGEGNNARDNRVEGNIISNTIHGIGIHTGRSGNPGIILTRNEIFNNRNEHIFISDGYQTEIVNNIMYGPLHSGQAGILLYNTDQAKVVNNTLNGTPEVSTAGIAIGNAGIATSFNVVIKNNILTRWNKAIQNRDSGNSFSEIGYNLFFENVNDIDDLASNTGSQIPSDRTGDLFTSPGYIDAASRKYHLLAGSPAIDRAAASNAPEVDFDGQARPFGEGIDIGADEASSDAPIPPSSCSGSGCGGGDGSGNPTASSEGENSGGFGCGAIQSRAPRKTFDRSHLGDLLLLSVPFFYFLFMRSAAHPVRRRGT
ncbi:MAG: right-handed parallel beta-helix repeat-containing protein [Candidatus Manganitrophus sp.]|nr:MAG: right-handed parallel beta-helix repeat-containing protein [Candidatus Manganitrophus sp.]